MSDLIQDKARLVCNEIERDPQLSAATQMDAQGDHPFFDMILQLLQQLAPELLKCFSTPAKAHSHMQNPGPLVRIMVRRKARQEMGDEEHPIRVVVNAILKVAKDTTAQEYEQLAA